MREQTNTFHGDHHHNPNNTDDEEVMMLSNNQTLMLSSEDKARLRAPYQFSLIAKVLGKEVGLNYLKNHLHCLWAPAQPLDVKELGHGFFLLNFSKQSEYNWVLGGVPWRIAGHYISLHRWVPNFRPSEATINYAAVWVRLPELPIEYYDGAILSQIASTIGSKLIKLDPVTETKEKVRFARLCIVVDLNRPLLPHINLEGLSQQIEYEGLHVVCFQCRRFGHLQQDCPQHPCAITGIHETPSTLQSWISVDNSSSSSDLWPQGPPRPGQRLLQTPQDLGRQKFIVSSHNVAVGFEQENFPNPSNQPKNPKGKSATTSVSKSSPSIMMNVGQNNKQKKHLQPGEGTSSQPRLPPPQYSPQTHQTNPQPQGHVVSPFPPATEHLSAPPPVSAPVVKKPPTYSATTLSDLNKPQPSAPPVHPCDLASKILPYSSEVQSSTEKQEISTKRVELKKPSTEDHSTVSFIDSKISSVDIVVNSSPLPDGKANEHRISFLPNLHGLGGGAALQSSPKKFLSLNCHGAGDAELMGAILKGLVHLHQPSVIILFETRIRGDDAKQVIKDIGFTGYCVDPVGLIGGVWLLWRKEEVLVVVAPSNSQPIRARVQILRGINAKAETHYQLGAQISPPT